MGMFTCRKRSSSQFCVCRFEEVRQMAEISNEMESDTYIPRIAVPSDREIKLAFNWIFTAAIIFGNLVIILLILGSHRLRKSSKYILVASLAFADLSDGGCFLPMWTDILIQLRVSFSCQARYVMGGLGFGIACVCSLSVVALNTDFTFRRAFRRYKGWNRQIVIWVLLLLCWVGPCIALWPLIAAGMKDASPLHCYFKLEHGLVTFFLFLAFFIPSGAVLISTGFVIYVHCKTKQDDSFVSASSDTTFPLDVVIAALLTLLFYLPFGVLMSSTYNCNPAECYGYFLSRFLVIGNFLYAKSAILPWIWLLSPRFREEIKDMFC